MPTYHEHALTITMKKKCEETAVSLLQYYLI